MQIPVNVVRAIQEYDLDSRVFKNFLVIQLGGQEIKLETTEEHIQQAIREASLQGVNAPPQPAPQRVAPVAAVSNPPFVQELLDEYDEDEDEDYAIPEGYAPPEQQFEDINALTEEDIAPYMSLGGDEGAGEIDVVSDDLDEGGTLAGIIAKPAQQQRREQISKKPHISYTQQKQLEKLRRRAKSPPVSGNVHTDEAGNPIVTPKVRYRQPEVLVARAPTEPNDTDGFVQG